MYFWKLSIWISFYITYLGQSTAYQYDANRTRYNLNQNQYATGPLEYWGEWLGHQYTPSPSNWRFPFYTFFLDRFVNGDPTNDNINNTPFEHDPFSNQMRHGGDLQGLVDTLDYLQGMGVKGIYIAGSPFMNQPWGYDQYSPLDLTLLDQHFGDIDMWRTAIKEMHARNMYVILDNTFATLGDLLGFAGYLNTSAPFDLKEHEMQYKTHEEYADFKFGNIYNATCKYPRFWLETGYPAGEDVTSQMIGCYDSEFDQYGDTEATGIYPEWRRQLSKFGSVQDRLRDWHEPVRHKIEHFYCMMIAQLDVDGFRYDKAMQITIDALGYMNEAIRTCARRYGKENFFVPGELIGGNSFGALYVGRGRQPDMVPKNIVEAAALNNHSDEKYFLRAPEHSSLDASVFHYTVYRGITRFVGMDGSLVASYDSPRNWVDMWNDFLVTNDMINANTGVLDPRHMYGVTNQDVFRWPAIKYGVEKQLMGHFITTLFMPGIPLLLWGEEQALYVLDNTASNYLFGRQPMSSALAWQTHGCYTLDSTKYHNMPFEAARTGCVDDKVGYDHRDPSHPVRNIIHHMHQLRETFAVLNDGFYLEQLSNQTESFIFPASGVVATEIGIWSIMRSEFYGYQDLGSEPNGHLPIWFVFSNNNESRVFEFDCSNDEPERETKAFISPYDAGTTVKNLLYPYDEKTLESSVKKLGIGGSSNFNGCLSRLNMSMFDFRAYVPIENWVGPQPMITSFSPGHDARILSTTENGLNNTVEIELQFSAEMSCSSVSESISFTSSTETNNTVELDQSSIECGLMRKPETPPYIGAISSVWSWRATLRNVDHGVHAMTVSKPRSEYTNQSTNSVDKFMFRLGLFNNPIVFPSIANYSTTLLSRNKNGDLVISHSAAGADSWRYSTNWASSFSDWMPYTGGDTVIKKQPWSGTRLQAWKGEHVRVEYFSRHGGSSDHIQQGDIEDDNLKRRFPHLFLNGPYNMYGYDAGLSNEMKMTGESEWTHNFMTEWSKSGSIAQINVWGINADGKPDQSYVLGDVDGDGILDRLPPSSLSAVSVNITKPPPKPFVSWKFILNDGTLHYRLVPSGSMWAQLFLYFFLWVLPIVFAWFSVWLFMRSFYQVKFNQSGITEKAGVIRLAVRRPIRKSIGILMGKEKISRNQPRSRYNQNRESKFLQTSDNLLNSNGIRRTVLIATMEYDIEDWGIKIKIGGLGVMAQLMGKNLQHQNLIWCVPCIGGVDYPSDRPAESMTVTILGLPYEVKVQYHNLRNITYVLLDAPVFRQQSQAEPYPPRMDDLDSAIYYSAWNQCIAEAIKRFPIDLYHINDYHGAVAPLYLLPRSIPTCLSLHNAEFQGLWPMRTKKEQQEVCSVFNLSPVIVSQYVQFGEVFNLLHGGASYLRLHQQGFGAVGVSKKYGKRSFARYPIFWGLKKVGQLPNPDPSDTGDWDKKLPKDGDIHVDPVFETSRPELKRQAQEWAGLDQNADAELFVFVGRWSMQKGIDLIADVFPSILEANPKVQLICIGPVIDLYGKFAALKLSVLMKLHPGRVCSKPVFTALPPFIFSGAEFALIPSRDEPFGLVAVEFGRKGALGVGARVGGLGQMPGWWYTVESTTSSHLIQQFKQAIEEALVCKPEMRATMRARSAKQRFPVAQWVEDLEILQSTAMRLHEKVESTRQHLTDIEDMPSYPTHGATGESVPSEIGTPILRPQLSRHSSYTARRSSRSFKYEQDPYLLSSSFPDQDDEIEVFPKNQFGPDRRASFMTMGSHFGPGHARGARQADEGPQFRLPLDCDPDDDNESILKAESIFNDHTDNHTNGDDDDYLVAPTAVRTRRDTYSDNGSPTLGRLLVPLPSPPVMQLGFTSRSLSSNSGDTRPYTPRSDTALLPPRKLVFNSNSPSTSGSMLSVNEIVGAKKDFNLQKVDPTFNDATEEFYKVFEKKLEQLNGYNSESALCIEEFLIKSEKKWFAKFRNAKLGRYQVPGLSNLSRMISHSHRQSTTSAMEESASDDEEHEHEPKMHNDQFLLGHDYVPPTGLRKWMQILVGDWPVYSFFMSFGQIIAANSYQITLLTGEVGQSATKLYSIVSIYLITSIMWWILFRRFSSVLCLSLPFFFYGLAFVLIGSAHFASNGDARGWIQNMGTACYALASSSGSLFFSLNFGDEGGAQVESWVFRACMIQGTQQIYVVALWYWGSFLTQRSIAGLIGKDIDDPISATWRISAITYPIAILLWIVGLLMWFGLPEYYRQAPGRMPSFYTSWVRRKIVMWFFVAVVIQNFFLSAPYGRNWSFLWSSHHAPTWAIVLLVLFFFVGVWAVFLWIFGRLSKSHSWILPMFAIGLGAPRWAQIWWGTSNIGLFLPWAGGYTASALVSRALWLWLGTLDAVQGVGLGMILLGTLTRTHVAFTLITAQVLGSLATLVARAVAPNNIGPGPISPDITGGLHTMASGWFWAGLVCNIAICVGYFMFYRKEQLSKP